MLLLLNMPSGIPRGFLVGLAETIALLERLFLMRPSADLFGLPFFECCTSGAVAWQLT